MFTINNLPPQVDASFAEATAALTARLEAITAAAAVVDATLEGAAKATLGRMQHDLQSLHGRRWAFLIRSRSDFDPYNPSLHVRAVSA